MLYAKMECKKETKLWADAWDEEVGQYSSSVAATALLGDLEWNVLLDITVHDIMVASLPWMPSC